MAKKSEREKYWEKELERFRGSGLSKAAFSRRRGYSAWSLTLWERRLGQERAGFAPVVVRAAEVRQELVRIRFGGMEVEGIPPAAWLAELLKTVQEGRP
jgi:hypothetical protein